MVAGGDHGAPVVILREEAELIGKVGDVNLLLPKHLHQIGLRHIDRPLHVIGRIAERVA